MSPQAGTALMPHLLAFMRYLAKKHAALLVFLQGLQQPFSSAQEFSGSDNSRCPASR